MGRMGEKRRCASVGAEVGVVQYDGVRFCDLRKIGKIWIKCSKKEKIATANVKKM